MEEKEKSLPDPDADMHREHRQRLRRRFLESGLESFTDEQALELLLFYAIPRKDVRKIARGLLRRFRSFSGVLEAEPHELTEVEGVGEQTASLLALLLPVFRRYTAAKDLGEPGTREELLAKVSAELLGRRMEALVVLCVDSRYRLLTREYIQWGNAHALTLETRSVLEPALRSGASAVILIHSHPNGELVGSEADLRFTRRLEAMLTDLGIRLDANLIWRDGEYRSVD